MSEQAPTITCRDLVELVTDYLEGQIAEVQRHAIEEHLGDCPGCDEYVRQMRLTIDGLRGLASDEVMFPQTRDELMRVFADLRPPH
jgi:anti-sigma factor RsiW